MSHRYQICHKTSMSNHALAAKYCILLVSLLLLSLLSLLCIICAVVFIVVVVECLHSAGLAFNVLSSGLAFNVLSSGLAFNVLLLLHFSGLVVQCAVIANSDPSDRPTRIERESRLAFRLREK